MADEKTILTVDLYDNVLTEKLGDYTGKIRITGTVRTNDVANRVVKKRTEYRPETIVNILDLSYQEMIEALVQGKCVVNALGQFILTISGPFDGKKQDYKSDLNRITVTFTPSAALLKALENIYVNADVATVGPMIENITDSTTGDVNLRLTPNAPAIISGSTLLIKGNSPSNGVYFTKDEEGAAPQKVGLIVRNTKGEIIIQIPALADGQYWLSVTTQVGSNYTVVKEPRTYRFPILLTVGEMSGGDGDSESPDEI